jgi:hypothetical protein
MDADTGMGLPGGYAFEDVTSLFEQAAEGELRMRDARSRFSCLQT